MLKLIGEKRVAKTRSPFPSGSLLTTTQPRILHLWSKHMCNNQRKLVHFVYAMWCVKNKNMHIDVKELVIHPTLVCDSVKTITVDSS